MRTAVAAPAPRPSDEEMLEAIAAMKLGDWRYVWFGLNALFWARVLKIEKDLRRGR